mmetsp:Transcript_3422/g.7127  ORF Transcript_3422/g.7127 Transcript_3422/m.7127 type:complete len:190 (+) Transcript_3422:1287-1856(+)
MSEASTASDDGIAQKIIQYIESDDPSSLRKLFKDHQEFINKPLNDRGWTPIFFVAKANSLKMASVLLVEIDELNAKCRVNKRDTNGYTPLMVAVEGSGAASHGLAQFLCMKDTHVLAKSSSGKTALDLAEDHPQLLRMLQYYSVKGPYAQKPWHKYKGFLWAIQTIEPWRKFKHASLVREVVNLIQPLK